MDLGNGAPEQPWGYCIWVTDRGRREDHKGKEQSGNKEEKQESADPEAEGKCPEKREVR